MVFQSYALFPHMTVIENVALRPDVLRLRQDRKSRGRAKAGLELVGLAGFGDRLPSELSGGQQQRVAVARALVLEPQVLLFDEPLSNLDAKLRRHVREEIREIQQKLGLTVVYVTHDQEEALAVSDRIIVMNNAVIAQDGTPRELYDAPANALRRRLHRRGQYLRLRGRIGRRTAMATVRLGPLTLQTAGAASTGRPGKARRAAEPHRRLHPAGTPNTLPGTLDKVTYVGSHLEFVVGTEFGEVFVVSPDVDAPFAAGETVGIGFPERGPVLIRAGLERFAPHDFAERCIWSNTPLPPAMTSVPLA